MTEEDKLKLAAEKSMAMKSFGCKIKAWRRKAAITQKTAVDQLLPHGFAGMFSHIELGIKANLTYEMCAVLDDLFGLQANTVFKEQLVVWRLEFDKKADGVVRYFQSIVDEDVRLGILEEDRQAIIRLESERLKLSHTLADIIKAGASALQECEA